MRNGAIPITGCEKEKRELILYGFHNLPTPARRQLDIKYLSIHTLGEFLCRGLQRGDQASKAVKNESVIVAQRK